MKKIIIGTCSALFFTGSSFAADMAVKAPPMAAPVAAAYGWTGFYIGGNVGYGWSHGTTDTFDAAGVLIDTTTHDRNGVFGGGQLGYNWQFSPNWLVGIEADVSASDIKGTTFACTATGCASGSTKVDDFGTVRARLGYVVNNFLLYGTGGWAWSHSNTDRTITCVVAGGGVCPGGPSPSPLTGMVASASGSQGGWVAGAGVEWLFAPNWTAKVEYQHLQFDNVGRDYNYTGFPTAFRHQVSDTGTDTVRVGVNYLFNIGGPAVARY
jgi:outer membrane immunogenic protein